MAENTQVDLSVLNYYKDLYSGHKIIYVRFLGEDFLFRTLTRKEYKYIMQSSMNKYEIEDAVCNTACVFPDAFDANEWFAGLVGEISERIVKESSLADIRDVLQTYKNYKEYSNLEIQCMDLIKAFIPEYTYDEMEEWTWDKLMYTTVRAEKIAELKGFDWHIEDNSTAYMEEMNSLNMDNKTFIEELKKNGVDPMIYFAEQLKPTFTHEIIDFPLIGGTHWNNEEVLNVIRKQLTEKNSKRRASS